MTPDRSEDSDRFGTAAFYASVGRAFVTMCFVVPGLFLIELIDQLTNHRLEQDGAIVPLHASGLDGIVLAPFLHSGWPHLYGNAIPLLLTGTFVLAGGGRRFLWTTAFIALVSGLGVWFFGAGPTVGASGVIFGYIGVLFVRGFVERSWWNIAVALLVGLLYWSALSGVVPSGDQRISWQAHLAGLIGGMIAAILFRRRRPQAPASPDNPYLAPTITMPLSP